METNFIILLQIYYLITKFSYAYVHACVCFTGRERSQKLSFLFCSVELIYKIFICNIVDGNISSIMPLCREVGDNTLLIIKCMQIDTCSKLKWSTVYLYRSNPKISGQLYKLAQHAVRRENFRGICSFFDLRRMQHSQVAQRTFESSRRFQ